MKKITVFLIVALILASGFACTTTPNVTPSPAVSGVPPTEITPPGASPETSPAISPETSPGVSPETSPGNSAVPEASPGTGMTASAKGYGGDVTATLALKDGNIEELILSGPNETEGVGKAAIETYNKTLAELKGKPLSDFDPSKLDTVSGATVTSAAVKTVLQDVISKAK